MRHITNNKYSSPRINVTKDQLLAEFAEEVENQFQLAQVAVKRKPTAGECLVFLFFVFGLPFLLWFWTSFWQWIGLAIISLVVAGGYISWCERIIKPRVTVGAVNARLLPDARLRWRQDVVEILARAEHAILEPARQLEKSVAAIKSASRNLEDRAFSPFWEDVETALTCLGNFNKSLAYLDSLRRAHAEIEGAIGEHEDPFPLADEYALKLNICRDIADDLTLLVSRAQRDFQFAVIFEQRRMSGVLIDGLGRIESALDALGDKVSFAADRIVNSADRLEKKAVSILEEARDGNQNTRIAQDRAIRLLDQIQRQRRRSTLRLR